jgi:hypothetical protein
VQFGWQLRLLNLQNQILSLGDPVEQVQRVGIEKAETGDILWAIID